MAWMFINPEIHSVFSTLGVLQGDSYNISNDCFVKLVEIWNKLLTEDRTLRTFRRAIAFGQNIKKDLVPLLINIKHDLKLMDITIKILVNLTVPVECLLSTETMSKTDVGRHTIFELNRLLSTAKECFVDCRTTKAILDYMKQILEKDEKLSLEQCDSINNCLLLLRNVLHIPESREITTYLNNMQNQIIWNLFTQSIDKLILHLISHPQHFNINGEVAYWGVTMVQLIALIYKDQHVGTLHKLLNLWFEASLSESSEDNESNTSPPDQGSGDSSPMVTSDPTSDSSDNGGSRKSKVGVNRINVHSKGNILTDSVKRVVTIQPVLRSKCVSASMKNMSHSANIDVENKKDDKYLSSSDNYHSSFKNTDIVKARNSLTRRKHMSINPTNNHQKSFKCPSVSELSDCGYGTQMEKESISTSSNDDDSPHVKPIHQKPPTSHKKANKTRGSIAQDKKEWRRKKLVKRSKTHIINMKGLIHHIPTDDDISNILKEFTVDFLLKGYNHLVQELHSQLLTDLYIHIDTSHFFWLVTYFLKFATQLELDLEHVISVLSLDIISYLIFEGVYICEKLELSSKKIGQDLKPCLRRIHLVITAIREFLQAIETYKRMTHLTAEDRKHITQLQINIASGESFKNLFVLLIRQYEPSIQNQQYLQDLIVTNHILLIFLDSVSKLPEYKGKPSMTDHLKKFATVEIMRQYGILLQNFQNNGEYINDCIFTMMHHVAGDLDCVSTLFQPMILKTFSQIWETDYEICDDWADLIEFVIHKFINTPQQTPLTRNNLQSELQLSEETNWTKEEIDKLCMYYVESRYMFDPISHIVNLYEKNGIVKNKHSIVNKLYEQSIINMDTYNDLKKIQYSGNVTNSLIQTSNPQDYDINMLKDSIVEDKFGYCIPWLQKILLDACYVKLKANDQKLISDNNVIDPILYYFLKMEKSIPIVAWSYEEKCALSHLPVVLLMHKLGLHLPSDTGKMFVRIPEFWTADMLFSAAQKLGSIPISNLSFDTVLLKGQNSDEESLHLTSTIKETGEVKYLTETFTTMQPLSMIRFTPLPNPPTNWFQAVTASNATNSNQIASTKENNISFPICSPVIHTINHKESKIWTQPEKNVKRKIYFNEKMDSVRIRGDCYTSEYSELTSMSETASVVSNLTRMYVSDEEEKI